MGYGKSIIELYLLFLSPLYAKIHLKNTNKLSMELKPPELRGRHKERIEAGKRISLAIRLITSQVIQSFTLT